MAARDGDAELMETAQGAGAAFERLAAIMRRLRDPNGGCPWDLEQTYATIAPYTIEEAYEVADAIERKNLSDLRDELGDLALQVVYHAQIAAEEGAFTVADTLNAVSDKMVRRHPHVFGDAEAADWDAIKAAEKADKPGAPPASILDDVPKNLPALARAEKLAKRAARVGFDWPGPSEVMEKLREEADELVEAAESADQDHIAEEMGDLLFVAVNLARKLGVEPETALRAANAKFVRRFQHIETALAAAGRAPNEATLDEMEALWIAAKALEKAPR